MADEKAHAPIRVRAGRAVIRIGLRIAFGDREKYREITITKERADG